MQIRIFILYAGEVDHFIRCLIVEDEHSIAKKDKCQEVADDDTEFLSKVKAS